MAIFMGSDGWEDHTTEGPAQLYRKEGWQVWDGGDERKPWKVTAPKDKPHGFFHTLEMAKMYVDGHLSMEKHRKARKASPSATEKAHKRAETAVERKAQAAAWEAAQAKLKALETHGWYIRNAMESKIEGLQKAIEDGTKSLEKDDGNMVYASLRGMVEHCEFALRDYRKAYQGLKEAGLITK